MRGTLVLGAREGRVGGGRRKEWRREKGGRGGGRRRIRLERAIGADQL